MGQQNPPEKQPDKKDNPWGTKSNNKDAPPDLDVLVAQLKIKMQKLFQAQKKTGGPRAPTPETGVPNQGALFTLIIVAILIIWALSGIFIVSPSDRSVITRFGKYVGTVDPGIHWIPRLIESNQSVNVQKISTYTYKSEMLTKDQDIASAEVSVQYRVDNARDFLFNTVDPVQGIEQATASALRQSVGRNTLNDLLTIGRTQVRDETAAQLKELLKTYKAGIMVTDVTMQSVEPPQAVTAAFDDVISAKQEQLTYNNKAEAYAKQKAALANGQVARILSEAGAYQQQVVLEAKAATANYLAILPEYQLAPEVMRERLYLTTIESVLGQSTKLFVNQKNSNPILYLPSLDNLKSGVPAAITATQAKPAAIADTASNDAVSSGANSDTSSYASDRPSYPKEAQP